MGGKGDVRTVTSTVLLVLLFATALGTQKRIEEPGAPPFHNVRAYGAVEGQDATTAFQRALDAAQAYGGAVFFDGSYVISRTLTWRNTNGTTPLAGPTIKGAGPYRSILDNRVANGPLLKLERTVSFTFYQGGEISDFQIRTTTSPAESSGIEVRSWWLGKISNVYIKGLTGDAIRILQASKDDGDGTSNLRVEGCHISNNGGYGITTDIVSTGSSLGYLHVIHNFILSNAAGGVKWFGMLGRFEQNSIDWNGGTGGLWVPYNAGHAQLLTIESNEFDSNLGQHIRIDALIGGFIRDNQWTAYYDRGLPPTTKSVVVGDGTMPGEVSHVYLERNRVRNGEGVHTIYDVKSDAAYTRIADTVYMQAGSTNVKFADAGTFTRWSDLGKDFGTRLNAASVNAATSYAPDLGTASSFKIRITSAGAFMVNNPSYAASSLQDGQALELILHNDSGGAVFISLGANFRASAVPNPATGSVVSGLFRFNGGLWFQIGSWSAAYPA